MNKKILIISLSALLSIAGSSLVFANFSSQRKVVTERLDLVKTTSIENAYKKINVTNSEVQKYTAIGNNYLADSNITNELFNSSAKVETYEDNIENQTEIIISDSNKQVKLNKDTGEVISYIQKNTSFETVNLKEDTIKEKALELFDSINGFTGYEFFTLEQFDEQIYLAKFCKKYGDLYNPGEIVCIGFSPVASEIVTFSQKSIPYANNKVEVSINDAQKAALPYLESSIATDMNITLEIVEPNYGLQPILSDGKLYTKANQTRLAYVCKFNNSAKTIVYIDCTTGEAIGTDYILGGEF